MSGPGWYQHTPAARDRLKVTFESRAADYHAARPDYPAELYEQLVAAAGLGPGARLLEVGCGTGKATIPLAARGFEITALELGPRLAEAARANLAGYDRVSVVPLAFESWEPAYERFDLVYAATAWHWVDPAVGYDLAWRALRPGGHLAIWGAGHVLPDDGDPFFLQIQDVYDEIGESAPADSYFFPRPGSLPTDRVAIEASGLFAVTLATEFIWALDYTADQYVALLDSFSSHIDMAPWQRDRLYGEVTRRIAARPGNTVRRHWGTVLQVARRLDG